MAPIHGRREYSRNPTTGLRGNVRIPLQVDVGAGDAVVPPPEILFVSFFLGHDAGDRARRLLADCEPLDVALSFRPNRHASSGDVHFGVSLRLPVEDKRLKTVLERSSQLCSSKLNGGQRKSAENGANG